MTDMREERAFLHDIFPCNAFPFLKRMADILRENHTNAPDCLSEAAKIDYRACLWVVNGQIHGQLGVIDMGQEWDDCRKYVEEKEKINARRS
jgi:hypothetical protein